MIRAKKIKDWGPGEQVQDFKIETPERFQKDLVDELARQLVSKDKNITLVHVELNVIVTKIV